MIFVLGKNDCAFIYPVHRRTFAREYRKNWLFIELHQEFLDRFHFRFERGKELTMYYLLVMLGYHSKVRIFSLSVHERRNLNKYCSDFLITA